MQQTEIITFGGGELRRSAELRGDVVALEEMKQAAKARFLPMWKNKPLVVLADAPKLHLVTQKHSILNHSQGNPVFLGLVEERPIFAVDVSGWQPPEGSEEVLDEVLFDPSQQALPGTDALFVELRSVMAGLSPLDAEVAATARSILSWHLSHGYCAACGVKSQVTQAGWQRSCPDCETQHFPRTDPVVIMLITDGNSTLLGRSPGWPEGMYSCLAGFLEPGETIETAVRREVYEETAVKVGKVSYLASQPWPYPSSLMIGCHGQALTREITIDPTEIEDAIWLTREEVLEVFAGQNERIHAPRDGAIATFLLRNWLADRCV